MCRARSLEQSLWKTDRLLLWTAVFVFPPSGALKGIQRMTTSKAGRTGNHHLWNNNGTWWCHLTVHLRDHTKERVRRSTGTRHIEEARQIRDFLLTVLPATQA